MPKLPAVCLAAAWLATGGCAPAQTVSAVDENVAAASRNGMTPVTDQPATPAVEELALQIASKHLSVPTDELEIVQIEPVEWRNSSLGCPQPGMEYLQVITPGHRALVRHESGTIHRVHMAGGGGLVCEDRPDKAAAKSPAPLPTFSRSQLEALARADLAHRLVAHAKEVSLVRTQPVEWPDATLGCVRAEAASESGASKGSAKGYIITLAHRGREYTYHADLRGVIPCPPIESR
jgi:hypothetical protein